MFAPTIHIGAPTIQLGAPTIRLGVPTIRLGAPNIRLGAPNIHLGATRRDYSLGGESAQEHLRCAVQRPVREPPVLPVHPRGALHAGHVVSRLKEARRL